MCFSNSRRGFNTPVYFYIFFFDKKERLPMGVSQEEGGNPHTSRC